MFQKLFGYNTNTLTLWVYKQQTCGKRVERKAHALYADMDIYIYIYWLVVSNIFLFSIIYGMSSFPLTFIFFRGVGQPPTSIYSQLPTLTFKPNSFKSLHHNATSIPAHIGTADPWFLGYRNAPP